MPRNKKRKKDEIEPVEPDWDAIMNYPLKVYIDDGCGNQKKMFIDNNLQLMPLDAPPTDVTKDMDKVGNYPLHSACLKKNLSTVKLLINTCDINSTDERNNTAIHIACQFGNKFIVNLLLSKNCNLDIENMDGNTPLDLAMARDNLPISQMLLSKNANLNINKRFVSLEINERNSLFEKLLSFKLEKCFSLNAVTCVRYIKNFLFEMDFQHLNFLHKSISTFMAKSNNETEKKKVLRIYKLLIIEGSVEQSSLPKAIFDKQRHKRPNKFALKSLKKNCCLCWINESNIRIECGHLFCSGCLSSLKRCCICRKAIGSQKRIFQI